MMIEQDKIYHFLICFALSFLGAEHGACLAAGLAMGKEYGDKNATNNKWCWWDMLANALGVITGFTLNKICF